MAVEKDLSNVVRPHLVFKATRFVRGEDQVKRNEDGILERELQDKRVDVSFQSNAWVDVETNLYGLSKARRVFDQFEKSVHFEDNLSSHKTQTVTDFQKTTTCTQRLFPPDLTHVLQPIDRHVGIIYKRDVYRAVRSDAMKRIRNANGLEKSRITPFEKRVLITKVVADTHERLSKTSAFRRSFIATATWMSSHYYSKSTVSLQGIKYEYTSVCSPEAIEAHKSVVEAEKSKLEAEKIKLETEKVAALKKIEEKKLELKEKFTPATEKSREIWQILELYANETTSSCFGAIAAHLGSHFICAGSFPAFVVAKTFSQHAKIKELTGLKYNDIDIYHGSFGDGKFERLSCKQEKVKGVESEVNFISCAHLSTSCLISNFDINAVAVCVHVLVENDIIASVKWTVTPQFWHFLLVDPTLQSWWTDSPSRTLVRLAYKSYDMGIPFSRSSLSLTNGELFTSHRKKVEEMKEKWDDYPFIDYKLKSKSKKSYVFVRVKTECQCGRKANLKCISKKCSKCCKLGIVSC